jgi:hypothetical protein
MYFEIKVARRIVVREIIVSAIKTPTGVEKFPQEKNCYFALKRTLITNIP